MGRQWQHQLLHHSSVKTKHNSWPFSLKALRLYILLDLGRIQNTTSCFFFPTNHGQVSVKIKLGKYFWSLTIRPFSFEKGELFHRATSLFLLILSVWVFSPGLTPLLLELLNLEKVLILFSARIHKQKKKKEFITIWYTVKKFSNSGTVIKKKKKVYTFPASQLELPVMYCGSQLCFCLTHPICQEGLTTVDIHLEGVMRGRQGQRSISESLMSISHQSTGVWSLKESVAEFKWRILKPELTPYFSAANPLLYLFKMEAQLLWKSLGHVRLFLTSWITCPWTSPGQNTGVGSLPFSRGSSQPRERTL